MVAVVVEHHPMLVAGLRMAVPVLLASSSLPNTFRARDIMCIDSIGVGEINFTEQLFVLVETFVGH